MIGDLLDFLSGGTRGEARDLAQQVTNQFRDLKLPSIEDMKVMLEREVLKGTYTPAQAQAILQQRSEMDNIQTDPRLREAQLAALTGLQDIAQSGGLTTADRGLLQAAAQEAGQYERGQREAILQNAQQRGVAGSGLEMLSKLQAQQSGADRMSAEGFKTAQLAQQRQMDALMQSGALGGQIRGQDFGQAADIARANDAINNFNVANRQDVVNRNVDANNQGQMFNLDREQALQTRNTTTRNQQELINKQLPQQDFNNRLSKTSGVADGLLAQSAGKTAEAGQNLGFVGSLVGTGGQMASSYQDRKNRLEVADRMAGKAASDRSLKQDVEPLDSAALLDALTGYKYKYKNKSDGDGVQVGVMAQDLQKVAPHAVTPRESDGKLEIDYGKLGGTILGALADMNKRLKDLE